MQNWTCKTNVRENQCEQKKKHVHREKNSEEMCENFVKNAVLGPQADSFLSAKDMFTEFFTVCWPYCLQPFVGGDEVCD